VVEKKRSHNSNDAEQDERDTHDIKKCSNRVVIKTLVSGQVTVKAVVDVFTGTLDFVE
jgi:hypothetical protein